MKLKKSLIIVFSIKAIVILYIIFRPKHIGEGGMTAIDAQNNFLGYVMSMDSHAIHLVSPKQYFFSIDHQGDFINPHNDIIMDNKNYPARFYVAYNHKRTVRSTVYSIKTQDIQGLFCHRDSKAIALNQGFALEDKRGTFTPKDKLKREVLAIPLVQCNYEQLGIVENINLPIMIKDGKGNIILS